MVTEEFRAEPQILFHISSCVMIMLCLIIWIFRRAQISRMLLRTAADLAAVSLCIAVNLLTATGTLTAGSGIADFAVKTGSALLALILTLIVGGDVRKLKKRADQPG